MPNKAIDSASPLILAGKPPHRDYAGLHAAISMRPAAGLGDMTAPTMRSMYGLPADRARQLAIAGTPSQIANCLRSTWKQEHG